MRILNMKDPSYPNAIDAPPIAMHFPPCRSNQKTPSKRWTEAGLAAVIALMSGCASIDPSRELRKDPALSKPTVAVTREAVINGTPEQVFAFIVAEDVLPKVLTGYGPLPAVVHTSGHTGPWDVPGSARLIRLADGTTVREQVTRFSRPHSFAYRVWDFGNPIVRRLADEARGEWTFVAVPAGTKVTWTYTFTAKNAWAAFPLSGIARFLWRGYMDVCLRNTQRLISEEISSP